MQASLKQAARSLLTKTSTGKKLNCCRDLWFHLERIGYFESLEAGLPYDRDGNCLPWFTYPSISFFKNKISPDMTVFEYGSGNSTLWWSKQVSSIVSCEHDRDWYSQLSDRLPENVDYIYAAVDGDGKYCQAILEYQARFDVVVIDGRDRVNCAKNSLQALKDDGVIIWDNSEREKYRAGYDFLLQNGFRRIDFTGLGPINPYEWCTSIFYRNNNCFGI